MRESYGEGVASRTGPESCVGVGEALTGVLAGRVLSRESLRIQIGVPMSFYVALSGLFFVSGNRNRQLTQPAKLRRPSGPDRKWPVASTRIPSV